MSWTPKRSLAETEDILCGPGCAHEVETRLIDGKLLKVYKNLAPTLRAFWVSAAEKNSDKTYIVFDGERYTYRQVFDSSVRTAGIFYTVYGVRKGDRVAVCSRNVSEYLVIFWAIHLLGAVPVLVNAWLPLEPLTFCLVHTQPRLLIVDAERADILASAIDKTCAEAGIAAVLVLHPKGIPQGMENYHDAVDKYLGAYKDIFTDYPTISPEDNAIVMFTSGTTGLPKGVLSTQRQFLTNTLNTIVGGRRALLRRGGNLPGPAAPVNGPQKGALIAVPLFHVTGTTSYTMLATMSGMKIILMTKWITEEAARLIREENVSVAGGVPAMVSDLMDSSLAGYPLEGLFFGGSPAPEILSSRAREVFPAAELSQGYGLTETNSISVAIAGEDYMARPGSTGLPSPVNEVAIVLDGVRLPRGQTGEVWLRGPNVMKGYWRDPVATNSVLTSDGWLKSGDLGMQDQDGFLYIKDRSTSFCRSLVSLNSNQALVKDIIIRGGESISSISIENGLYNDPRLAEVAAVGLPDPRLGELVAAVVSVKPAFKGKVTEESVLASARKNLPRFAIPVMILVLETPFELTPSGKIMKGNLRTLALGEWKKRNGVTSDVQSRL
ncbi:acetyl-CoA synthetase-like protein [Armillaria gallica]|uniref:Acetyl-CoA synthetase-like protein n=1 Tax=Armillaria gallica TaxID=47427 RepID=A0A2H3DLT4_ARMGA|nr:acetyl-CoA synthetase-like protein [Armillaria gallica]